MNKKEIKLLNIYECTTLEELTDCFSELQYKHLETVKENQQLKQRVDELETLQPKFKVEEEFTDTDIMCFLLTKYNLDIEEVKNKMKEV